MEHQHGVLAAEFQRAAHQPGSGAASDLAAGAGGAGEGDVVGAFDDGGADDVALADDDLPHLGREAASISNSRAHRAVSAVWLSGFITTAFPATKAGNASPTESPSG